MTARQLLRGVACAALFALAPAAQAASLTAGEVLQQFNVVVFNDLNMSSNTEGRTLVGGDVKGNSGDFGTRTPPASSFETLTVGGNIEGNAKQVNNGNVVVGGGVQSLNMNSGGSVTMGGVRLPGGNINNASSVTDNATVNIPDFSGELKALSTSLRDTFAGSGATPTTTNGGNRGLFTAAVPNADGIAAYNTESTFFDGINEIELALNGASTVIVNIAGTNVSVADNFLGGPLDLADNFIWNFFEAETLTLSTQFFGTVLAPFAEVTNTSAVEGAIIADALNQNGQAHLQPFSGPLPPSVPLPPAVAMLGAVMGVGAGLAAWRKRKAAAA